MKDSSRCNLCGAQDSTVVFEWARLERNNIRQCNKCGLIFLEMTKSKEQVERFYESDYRKLESGQTAEQHYSDAVTQKDVESQYNFILRCLIVYQSGSSLEGKNILEIGSASGGLLEKLSGAGCVIEGIELNEEYREFSKNRGAYIFSEPVERLEGIVGRYDVVVAFHTVEHFPDPKGAFMVVHSMLKRGGVFIGEVPNQDEWAISIFDNEVVKRLHYNPNHYYYFTPKTMRRYLQYCGFHKIKIETVERYNSVMQLRNVLCGRYTENKIEEIIKGCVFPKSKQEDYRLHEDDEIEKKFNTVFGKAVNAKLMGSCLRFVAAK